MSRETISKVPERIVNLCTSMFNRVDIFQHFSALDIEKCKDIFSNYWQIGIFVVKYT